MSDKVAVITGFGLGLAESLANRLLLQNYQVIGLSRSAMASNDDRIISLACDVSDATSVSKVFAEIRQKYGSPELLIHNAASLLLEVFLQTKPHDFEQQWRTSCLGAVLVTQEILPAMLEKKQGTLLYTGATASIKAGAQASAFASAKFALRGLAQSLARAYGPEGIHVIHTVLDGVIWGERAEHVFKKSSSDCMQVDDIADTYLTVINQEQSSWTHEIDLRPYKEQF